MGRRRKYASGRERLRAFRARQRASAAHRLDAPTPAVVAVVDHADPVGALVEWSRTALVVPPGHPRSGEPLELLPFAVDWLRTRGTCTKARCRPLERTRNLRSARSWRWPTSSVHFAGRGGAGRLRAYRKKKRASCGGKCERSPRPAGWTYGSGAHHIRVLLSRRPGVSTRCRRIGRRDMRADTT